MGEMQPQQCKLASDEVRPPLTALICSAMPRLNNIIRSSSCSFVQPQAEIQEGNKTSSTPLNKGLESLMRALLCLWTWTPAAKALVLPCHQGRSHMLWVGVSVSSLFNQSRRGCSVNILRSLCCFWPSDTQAVRGGGIEPLSWACPALHSVLCSWYTFTAFGTFMCLFPSWFYLLFYRNADCLYYSCSVIAGSYLSSRKTKK